MLEPGLLRIFRFFTALQIGAALVNTQLGFRLSPNPRMYSAVHAVGLSILLCLLLSGALHRWLGRYFLPLVLILAVLEPTLSRIAVEAIQVWQGINRDPADRI